MNYEQLLESVTTTLVGSFKTYTDKVRAAISAEVKAETARLDAKLDTISKQVGPVGPQGERGERGEPGEKGMPGEAGPVGPVGPQGEKGEPGEKGIQGDVGPQGPQGEKGLQGDIGPQGERGEKGEPGEKGIQGDVGPQGPQGEKGLQGDIGPQGERGEKGEKGDKGDVGPAGPQGEPGPAGPQGEKGIQGDIGPEGPQGRMGPAGQKGDAGRDAAELDPIDIRLERSYPAGTWARYRGGLIRAARTTDPLLEDTADVVDCGWKIMVNGFNPPVIKMIDRTVELSILTTEGKVKETFSLPVLLDKGVYSPDNEYEQGDVVSFGGSMWIAQQDTKDKPGTDTKAWRLSVKHGRDGRDGVMKEPPAPKVISLK